MLFELVASRTQPVSNITVNRRQNARSLFRAYAEAAVTNSDGRKALRTQLKQIAG